MPNLKCLLPLLVAFFITACGKEIICDNAEICEAIGKIYIYGYRGDSADYHYPSPQELEQAKAFFQKSCDLNSAKGCYHLGFTLRAIQKGFKNYEKADSTDSDEIVKIWQKACEIDELLGNVCLGIGIHYKPDESPISAKLRRDFLTKSCELSYRENETEGRTTDDLNNPCYFAGIEWFKTDKQKAIAIYEEACECNDRLSCKELGRIYEKGLGVKADTERAKKYYQMAGPDECAPYCEIRAK